ncbi:MAG: hypothetical protein ACI8RZ_004843 [Myxococcota bacterium]|jgi:hypothetical protein
MHALSLLLVACAPKPEAVDADGDGFDTTEVCDGIDNNCGGGPGTCRISGNLTGDGRIDLIISAPDAGHYDGFVYLFLGGEL